MNAISGSSTKANIQYEGKENGHMNNEAKQCSYYQVPLYNRQSALTLEQSLLEFTGLDVLDEDNKFICQDCTNGKYRV